jgi:Holliday junction resolvase RusA-like endonuclease
MIKFTLLVRPTTKKNSGRIVMRGKYPLLLPSENYLKFEKAALPYLNRVKAEVGVINYPVNIKAVFYTETRRRIDLTNLLNAIDDAMSKSGLIIDDNRDIIAGHDGSRVYYAKHCEPCIEIEITSIENYEQWKDTTIERLIKE